MQNKALTRQTIHDPRPIQTLVSKEDYAEMSLSEYPVVEIQLPDNTDISIRDGVLSIIKFNGTELVKQSVCLFDKPLFDIVRYIDAFGISAKFLSAIHGLYPAIFLNDIDQQISKQVIAESSPFNLSEIILQNCFYAKNMITDIKRSVIFAQESLDDNMLDCKYINVSGDDVFTDKHYSEGQVSLLVNVRVKRFYLCVKKNKYLPMHTVQETCFNESSSVRKAAIAYNAKVRNANK